MGKYLCLMMSHSMFRRQNLILVHPTFEPGERWLSADQELSELAGELKLVRKMSCRIDLPQLAKRENAETYTGDPEFKTVEREIKVVCYRSFLRLSKQIRNTQSRPS